MRRKRGRVRARTLPGELASVRARGLRSSLTPRGTARDASGGRRDTAIELSDWRRNGEQHQDQGERAHARRDREPRHASPLVLHNELHLHGPRFGCGLAQCGACSVLLDGKEIRSCVTPGGRSQREEHHDARGAAGLYAASARHDGCGAPALHPLQQAWIDVQVPHCGYCQNGMMIQAADLLATTKNPSEDQIRTAMNGHLCRCGTYPRILTAIQKAAAVMAKPDRPVEALLGLAANVRLGRQPRAVPRGGLSTLTPAGPRSSVDRAAVS